MKSSPVKSYERVWRTLSSVTPKTINQLVEETGLSRSTVSRALQRIDATISVDRALNDRDVYYLRPAVKMVGDPAKHWRHSRLPVADVVRTLIISEHADPAILADQFLSIGRQLTEIGEAIDKVKVDPDWYTKLGGHFWLSDEERNEG